MRSPVITFARLTIWEASRRRLLLAIVLLTVLIVIGTGYGFSRLWSITDARGNPIGEVQVHLVASQLLIAVAFVFGAVLALSSVLVAAPSISNDLESGMALSLLARPVRRAELALGKWLGLAVLVLCYAWGSGVLELAAVRIATGYLPPHPVFLLLYISGQGLVLLTLSLLLSTRMAGMTAGIVGLVGYFLAWVGGVISAVGQTLNSDALRAIGLVTKLVLPTDALWHGAVWAMEPASVIAGLRLAGPAASGNPFAGTDPMPAPLVAWSVLWVAGLIALTIWSFRSREV